MATQKLTPKKIHYKLENRTETLCGKDTKHLKYVGYYKSANLVDCKTCDKIVQRRLLNLSRIDRCLLKLFQEVK